MWRVGSGLLGRPALHLGGLRLASTHVDHYAVLGLSTSASSKEIKAAYYQLSKKFHPDTNPDNKDDAAKLFQAVAESYEVLGSPESKKIYDMTRARTRASSVRGAGGRMKSEPHVRQPQYTDIDIDYKNFEQFQRKARNRRQHHSHFEMPDEFFAEFGGGKNTEYRSEFDEATARVASRYKDSRAAQREYEEMIREIEREKKILEERYPIPTFEQLIRKKRAEQEAAQKKMAAGMLSVCATGMILFLLIR